MGEPHRFPTASLRAAWSPVRLTNTGLPTKSVSAIRSRRRAPSPRLGAGAAALDAWPPYLPLSRWPAHQIHRVREYDPAPAGVRLRAGAAPAVHRRDHAPAAHRMSGCSRVLPARLLKVGTPSARG